MAVLFAGCKDGGGTGSSGPASVVAASPTTQTAVVGTAVAQGPAVRVTDRGGQPMAGVAVTFAVTAGSGTLASTSAATDAQGVATAGTWTLGYVSGQQTVTATVGNLPPVQFVATAQERTPTTITAATPTTLTGPMDQLVVPKPVVRVLDQLGTPMARVPVIFAVTGGGGSMLNTSQTTDTTGHATAHDWRLGPQPGVNTMTATVAGLPPVTFTATAYDPCSVAMLYTPLTVVVGQLQDGDCEPGNFYADLYLMTLPAGYPITLRMGSTDLDSWLDVYDADGNFVAYSDDGPTPPNSEISLFAPAGDYLLVANSYYAYETGRYDLTSSAFTENTGCGEYWVVPGITVNGTITTEDCDRGGVYTEEYLVVLRPGDQLTVRMETSAFDPVLQLYDAFSNTVLLTNDDGGGGTAAQIVYTATQYRVFGIVATADRPGITGAYGVSFTVPQVDRPGALRANRLPTGLMDAGAAIRGRAGERKAAPRGPRAVPR
ncbi:MAG TPA: hypothetical protein VFR37_03205 [Longimicrobium sp.]|nr:hypothetical protein [Longimicrobium sp.]